MERIDNTVYTLVAVIAGNKILNCVSGYYHKNSKAFEHIHRSKSLFSKVKILLHTNFFRRLII